MDEVTGETGSLDSAHTISRKIARSELVEIITRSERRRSWTSEEKHAIMPESVGADRSGTQLHRGGHGGAPGRAGTGGSMSGVDLHRRAAFAGAHHWRPEPAAEAQDDIEPDPIELALRLLSQIAEDPYLRGSHRVQARRYLRRLEAQAAGTAATP
jgi:hypothetical protein